MFSAVDHEFMAGALQLAERGLFSTTPNPRVGCVLVRDGIIVGEGWHLRAGEAHAEVHALKSAGEAAAGSTALSAAAQPANRSIVKRMLSTWLTDPCCWKGGWP